MHSFATREAIEAHLDELDWCGVIPDRRFALEQSVMPRVTLEGVPLTEVPEACELGDAVLFAPTGHGDVLELVQRAGTVARLRTLGVRHLLVSNVDNLGATLDPLLVGAHLESGHLLTAEAIVRRDGDAGASVCEREDGRVVIIEDPRLPVGMDPLSFPHFSVNNLWIRVEAMGENPELDWCAVRKRVAKLDPEVIQLERFVNQLAELVDTGYVIVQDGRFVPIKTRDDLVRARAKLLAAARAAGLIDPWRSDSMEGEST
jgi:UTP--glucose-1-phosphate uridylyltransferase